MNNAVRSIKPISSGEGETSTLQARGEAALERYSQIVRTISPGEYTLTVGDAFKIDLESREITLGTNFLAWAEEHPELGEKGVLWALCHEVAHYDDLLTNSAGTFAHFQHMEVLAHRFTPNAQAVLEQRGVKVSTELLEGFIYKQIATFWNILEDMYVNQRIGLSAKTLDLTSDFVVRLYRDFILPVRVRGQPAVDGEAYDITQRPKSRQLALAMLAGLMVPDRGTLVGSDVQEVLESIPVQLRDARHNLNFRELVLQCVAPRNTDCAKRHASLYFAQDAFLALLLNDLATMKVTEEQLSEAMPDPSFIDGEGNEQGEDMSDNPWTLDGVGAIPATISKEDAAAAAAVLKASAKPTPPPAVLTPDDAMRASFLGRLHNVALQENLTLADANEYFRLRESVKHHIASLADEFKQLLTSRRLISHSDFYRATKTGTLDIAQLIQSHAPMLAANMLDTSWGTTPIYRNTLYEEKLTILPDNIRFTLVLDNSGSMVWERLEMLKRVSVLIMEVMYVFETLINQLLPATSKEFVCESEVLLFGSRSVVAKAADSGVSNVQSEYAARMLAVRKISNWLGGTNDASALRGVAASLKNSPETVKALQDGSSLHFAFEITDGGSGAVRQTVEALEELDDLGVVMHSFQVGTTTPEEDEVFEHIWAKRGTRITDLQQLTVAVGRVFFESVKDQLRDHSFADMEGYD